MAAVAAVEGAQLDSRSEQLEYSMVDSDLDAEGEDDPEMDYPVQDVKTNTVEDDLEMSDADAEGEEVDDDEDDGEGVGAVKIPAGQADLESEEEVEPDDAASEEEDSDVEEEDSDKDSSDAESGVEEDWEAASEGAEEGEVEVLNRNNCIFCSQDEEHDPSEEFEEYMACAVCGDNSHRQCARDAKSLKQDEDAEQWRCPGCVENALEPDSPEESISRRRSSAPKLARDLLPAQRGAPRPGSHSVFNNLILDDDPMDGSRSLRKRKASSEVVEEPIITPKKRRRKLPNAESESEDSVSPTVADDEEEKHLPKEVDEHVGSVEAESKARPSRPQRPRRVGNGLVSVLRHKRNSIILALHIDPSNLSTFVESQPKKVRRRPGRRPASEVHHTPFAPSYPPQYATGFYSFHERENDELKSKPYGGILSEADADTSKTLPQATDRKRFDDARQQAEEEWKQKAAILSETQGEQNSRTSQKVAGPPSKIKCISFGGWEIDTWYAAPYPEEYSRNRVLYICEFCLKYMNSDYVAWRHKLKCPAKHPPGDEIYRDGSISVFEVDGRKNPVYCQNLCLLAKLFLGSKTLYYDVEPFLFYVMTEYDEFGCHFVGYFSKEKRPSSQNNVSCILTLPIHQRKGYGNLLIDFSYLLTRVERKTGSPEKPLSDMGLVSYRNYWRLVLSYQLLNQKIALSITDISDRTGMTADDIVSALEGLRALVRDPITRTYALRLDYSYFKQCIDSWEAKRYVQLNPEALVWTPYIMGRNNLAHYERGPPLPTRAPREGEEDGLSPVAGVQLITTNRESQDTKKVEVMVNGNANTQEPNEKPKPEDTTNEALTPKINNLNDKPSPDTPPEGLPPLTPGPPLLTIKSTSPSKLPSISTPKLNGEGGAVETPTPSSVIPPTRFEIFPPVPGTATRRRPGRPFGRGGRRTSTPVRRGGKNLNLGSPTPGMGDSGGRGKFGRRTRSKLADVVDGTVEEEGKKDDEGLEVEEGKMVVNGHGSGSPTGYRGGKQVPNAEGDEESNALELQMEMEFEISPSTNHNHDHNAATDMQKTP
ncbi:MAG: hypothetical protein M1830_001511 [Pleopsidium flavum]|nr:MAG: hypothetical protein M1830_001511 [Pleopsidium flavum]